MSVAGSLLLALTAIGIAMPTLITSGMAWADPVGASLFGAIGAVALFLIALPEAEILSANPEKARAFARARGWHAYVLMWIAIWLVLITRPGAWLLALAHWPMALVMVGGSLVAGSTPMGGGTVSFPALVLAFGRSPAMARDFGLAIQSAGMTSALLYIVARGIPVAGRLLAWACAGAVVGLVLGTFLLAGRVPADSVKLLFATLWITFGAWLVTGNADEASAPRASANGRRRRR